MEPISDASAGKSASVAQRNSANRGLIPLEEIGTAECRSWRKRITQYLGEFRPAIEKRYQYLASTEDYVTANQWLAKTIERMDLGQTGLKLDSPMEAVRDYAKAKARGVNGHLN
ncbi:hypothetical protein [Marinimicrobium locisalis]|uniref:hypothetical protein n=1 Tax=Marinimicrobium locisalis TaxID=546022 RepID=UPI003221B9D3